MIHTAFSVMIADDHRPTAAGYLSYFNERADCQVVAVVHDGEELLRKLLEARVDLVLLDLQMPMLNGMEAAKIIKEKYKATKLIAMSAYDDEKILARLKAIGVEGFCHKGHGKAELFSIVDKVLKDGTMYLVNEVKTKKKERSWTYGNSFETKYKLSSREFEIAQLISEGLSTKAISEKLFIAELTVETHRKNIKYKIGFCDKLSLYKLFEENDY